MICDCQGKVTKGTTASSLLSGIHCFRRGQLLCCADIQEALWRGPQNDMRNHSLLSTETWVSLETSYSHIKPSGPQPLVAGLKPGVRTTWIDAPKFVTHRNWDTTWLSFETIACGVTCYSATEPHMPFLLQLCKMSTNSLWSLLFKKCKLETEKDSSSLSSSRAGGQ